MEDFFISYNGADKHWATGLGDWLDQAGFTTILQEQDFVPSSNFVNEMHKALQSARRMIMVLSPDYLVAKFPLAEWTAAFASDPACENGTLIPVRVRECQPVGLLRPIVYIDLVGLNVEKARDTFLDGIKAVLTRKRPSTTQGPPPASSKAEVTKPHQTAIGEHIIQVGGDQHIYHAVPKIEIKEVRPRREGAISSAQEKQVKEWIEALVENTVGITRSQAFGMWTQRFKNRFELAKVEDLLVIQLDEAEDWYRQQKAILTRKLKTKAPNAWRNARYGAIKQAMRTLGVDNATYYPLLAARLKMRRPFGHLTELTRRDLDRVYNMALRDAREGLQD